MKFIESLQHVFDACRNNISNNDKNNLEQLALFELFIYKRFSNFIDEVIKKSASETSIETQERLRRFDLAIKSDTGLETLFNRLVDSYEVLNKNALLLRLDNIEKFTLDRFLSSGVEIINDK